MSLPGPALPKPRLSRSSSNSSQLGLRAENRRARSVRCERAFPGNDERHFAQFRRFDGKFHTNLRLHSGVCTLEGAHGKLSKLATARLVLLKTLELRAMIGSDILRPEPLASIWRVLLLRIRQAEQRQRILSDWEDNVFGIHLSREEKQRLEH
jgi:hypothetical protein